MNKRAENWIFGGNAWINFSTGSPVSQPVGGNNMNTGEGCDSVSDAITGALLFYTDGESLYDESHVLISSDITNGAGLEPNLSMQAITVIQKPLSADDYILFMVGNWNTGGTLYPILYREYNSTTKVLGAVITLAPPTGSFGYAESLTAALHANNRDIWIITHMRGGNQFKVWEVLPHGVSDLPHTSVSSWAYTGGNRFGQIKVAPNGKKIAMTTGMPATGSPSGNPEILCTYNFDNATGILSGEEILMTTSTPGGHRDMIGVDFSRNSTVLYTSSLQNRSFFKFDLKLDPVQYVKKLSPNIGTLGAVQRGPDDRIYIAQNSVGHIYQIDNADDPTLSINETTHTLTASTQSRLGLPLAPQITEYIARDYRVYHGTTWYSICGADVIKFYDNDSASWKQLAEGDKYYNKILRDFETIECSIPTPPAPLTEYDIIGFVQPEFLGYDPPFNSSAYTVLGTDLAVTTAVGQPFFIQGPLYYGTYWVISNIIIGGSYREIVFLQAYLGEELTSKIYI